MKEKKLKILHTADWHANSNYEEFKKSYEQIVDYVINNDIDLVIIAGDVFDSRMFAGNNYSDILNDIKSLASYCSILIPYGTPSHDFKGCFAPFEKNLIQTDYPVKIINNHYSDNDTTVYFLEDIPNEKNPDLTKRTNFLQRRKILQETEIFLDDYKTNRFTNNLVMIQGLAWISKNRWLNDIEIKELSTNEQNELFKKRVEEYFKETKQFNKMFPYPSVWVGHLQLDNFSFSKGQDISSDTHSTSWVEGLADYVALGHIHKFQQYYAGSIYNKTWNEMEEKSFNVITINNNKIEKVETIKLETPMLIKIECDWDEYKKIKKDKIVENVSLENAKVWIRISINNKKTIDIDKELEYWKNICNMRIDIEKIKTDVIQRLEDYDKSINLVEKFKLWCEQKSIQPTNFQINKIKELESL